VGISAAVLEGSVASLDNGAPTQQQMLLAALLSGAPPQQLASAEESDTEDDAAPVTPAAPYAPISGSPEPAFVPPNLLAQVLAGGGVSMPPSGRAPVATPGAGVSSPASTPLPSGTHQAQLPGPPLTLPGSQDSNPLAGLARSIGIGGAPPQVSLPAPAAAPAPSAQAAQNIAGQASDIGTPEQREIYSARQALRAQEQGLQARIAGASTPEVAKIYADQLTRLSAYDQQLETAYLATIKTPPPLQTVTAGQYVLNPQTGKYEQPVPAENTTNAPSEEEAARLIAAGHNPKDYQSKDGELVPIAPERPVNTEIVHLADGTFQTVNKNTGESIGKPIGQPGGLEPTLTPQAIEELANRSIQGDNSALTSLGYGKIGAANRTAVANRVATMAQEQGIDATGIVRNIVGLGGEKAGARTMGQMGARINTFAEEAKQTGEMALTASSALPREAWVPIERIIQMGESAANNPRLSELQAANNAFANTYSKAVNPSGVPTDEGRRAAFSLLNVAKNPEAYAATVHQLQREMEIVQNAIGQSRATQLYGGQATPSAPPVPVSPGPSPTAPASGQRLSPADAAKLPSGTRFIGEDGIARVRH
jgi:hypothetical protein